MSEKNEWIGVDYGSKLAGTTVICYESSSGLSFLQSEKKKDADAFISKFLAENSRAQVFLDAPLSLPSAYFEKGSDFFYRDCDKQTKAMSPMFLGGLTARAMKLRHRHKEHEFFESYPAFLIKDELGYSDLYLKKSKYSADLHRKLADDFNLSFMDEPQNWHQLDALCCWLIGMRYQNKACVILGDPDEGLIYV